MSIPSIAGATLYDRGAARLAGGALALASLLAIAGFTVLGAVFQYPQILEEPTSDVLALFREHQGAVVSWFLVLVVSAALMAPAGVFLGRLVPGAQGRWIAGVGISAATVHRSWVHAAAHLARPGAWRCWASSAVRSSASPGSRSCSTSSSPSPRRC